MQLAAGTPGHRDRAVLLELVEVAEVGAEGVEGLAAVVPALLALLGVDPRTKRILEGLLDVLAVHITAEHEADSLHHVVVQEGGVELAVLGQGLGVLALPRGQLLLGGNGVDVESEGVDPDAEDRLGAQADAGESGGGRLGVLGRALRVARDGVLVALVVVVDHLDLGSVVLGEQGDGREEQRQEQERRAHGVVGRWGPGEGQGRALTRRAQTGRLQDGAALPGWQSAYRTRWRDSQVSPRPCVPCGLGAVWA